MDVKCNGAIDIMYDSYLWDDIENNDRSSALMCGQLIPRLRVVTNAPSSVTTVVIASFLIAASGPDSPP